MSLHLIIDYHGEPTLIFYLTACNLFVCIISVEVVGRGDLQLPDKILTLLFLSLVNKGVL